jgi:hypothetical protein
VAAGCSLPFFGEAKNNETACAKVMRASAAKYWPQGQCALTGKADMVTTMETRIKPRSGEKGPTYFNYLASFAAELFAMSLILWDGVPIFRNLVNFRRGATFKDDVILLIAALIIQVTYWLTLKREPPFALPKWPFLGHVLLFLSRLNFIFVSAVFSFVVYRYWDVFEVSPYRFSLMIFILFSVFCFSRHLEMLGMLMNTGHRFLR